MYTWRIARWTCIHEALFYTRLGYPNAVGACIHLLACRFCSGEPRRTGRVGLQLRWMRWEVAFVPGSTRGGTSAGATPQIRPRSVALQVRHAN